MTLTIEIEDIKQKSLENIAAQNGKKVSEFVVEILDDYLHQKNAESQEISGLMKLSEISFSEWDNEEDAVYDKL
ncbi:MAG: toxin-antitoxin system, antitoxin component, Xre family protein [Acidobacteria bacterium]|jgi:fructose-1,6-bisphosphatase/sedoheptulose 1,7-bisphosphatase-like protein|nr:toxin-antitoxin system, antitoxin component, Xre family protein [Acidobacteriota bacterium]